MYQECSESGCGNPVFARGICRKHYEQDRLASADPCSEPDCTSPASKRGMCESHYQKWRVEQNPLCKVDGCTEHARGKKYGLCQKHEYRLRRHSTVRQPRPDDWGARESHPLYSSWTYHRRINNLCDEWHDDFWAFVECVGIRPANHTLRKRDSSKPYSADNWYWKESIPSADRAKYAKKWRANNPDKAKNSDLKKRFGITLEDYERMFAEQGGVCKICGQKESSHQRDGSPSSLVVDHCHETQKIRGLLCHHCNRGIGLLKDDPEILMSAIKYLQSSP